jgi:glycerate kinase
MTVEAWPDEGGGVIPASDAAAMASAAWADRVPGSDVVALAVGDGGPRTADAVEGPRRVLGQAVAVECAAGILLAPLDSLRWNPHRLASALYGLAREVPDGGRPPTVIVPLGDVAPAGDAIDVWGPSLEAARDALARLTVIALVGASRPLLGFHGMAAATMAGRESDVALAAAAQEQERRWADIAAQVEAAGFAAVGSHAADAVGPDAPGTGAASPATAAGRGSLLGSTRGSGAPARISDLPGSGAAGGLAYCLAAAGARLAPGAAFAASLAGLDTIAPPPDLIVAICRDLTPRGLDHGSVVPASAAAARLGVPCVAITPAVKVGKRDLMASGISGAYPAEPGAEALADRVGRVAHTWTPRA